MTPAQCRMARAALEIQVRDLAEAAKVSTNTIVRFERGEQLRERTIDALRAALEAAGAEFVNGSSVRVRPRAFYLAPVDLSDAAWEASTLRGPLWVLAVSEREARQQAVLATAIAIIDKRDVPSPALGSPWHHAFLSTCEPKACPFSLLPGVALDEHGEPVDP
jgi:transcriptional regulator with XRE-family HTH domain